MQITWQCSNSVNTAPHKNLLKALYQVLPHNMTQSSLNGTVNPMLKVIDTKDTCRPEFFRQTMRSSTSPPSRMSSTIIKQHLTNLSLICLNLCRMVKLLAPFAYQQLALHKIFLDILLFLVTAASTHIKKAIPQNMKYLSISAIYQPVIIWMSVIDRPPQVKIWKERTSVRPVSKGSSRFKSVIKGVIREDSTISLPPVPR